MGGSCGHGNEPSGSINATTTITPNKDHDTNTTVINTSHQEEVNYLDQSKDHCQ
jgi:hypothetical protein